MTSEHKPAPCMDDFLKAGWMPVAETSLGITLEKSASSLSLVTSAGGVLLIIWGLLNLTSPTGMSVGITLLGLTVLAIYENTRPPQRMFILHESAAIEDGAGK